MKLKFAWLILIQLLVLVVMPGGLRAAGQINRGGYIAITIDPILYESNLWETSHRISLEQFFTSKAADLGEALAEGLEKTAFRGRLRVLPGYQAEEQAEFREIGTPDTFLLTVDIRSRYGLTDGSSLAACASGISCLLLSSAKMFTYASKTEATVTAFYFKPNGQRLRLVQEQFYTKGSLSGNFYDAMDMAQELEWITRLTDDSIDDLRRQIIAKLPTELVQRSWHKAEDDLNAPAAEAIAQRKLPPKPQLAKTKDVEPVDQTKQNPLPEISGQELNLQQLVRKISPAIFKVKTEKGVASGFVISERGFGVTALDIVDAAQSIQVRFHSGEELRAKLVQKDPELQLAIIAFEGHSPAALSFGTPMAQGKVVAVGYPLDFGLSITPTDIIQQDSRGRIKTNRLATSVPAGNAGGPLVNQQGQVVGILFKPSGSRNNTLQEAIAIDAGLEFFGHLADFRFN